MVLGENKGGYMNLKELFQKQRELDLFIEMNMEEKPTRQNMVRDKMLALLDEMGEFNHELKYFWGYWKKQRKFNPAKAKEEWTDILFFLISLGQEIGIDAEEAAELYNAKWRVNNKRQQENY